MKTLRMVTVALVTLVVSVVLFTVQVEAQSGGINKCPSPRPVYPLIFRTDSGLGLCGNLEIGGTYPTRVAVDNQPFDVVTSNNGFDAEVLGPVVVSGTQVSLGVGGGPHGDVFTGQFVSIYGGASFGSLWMEGTDTTLVFHYKQVWEPYDGFSDISNLFAVTGDFIYNTRINTVINWWSNVPGFKAMWVQYPRYQIFISLVRK